MTPQELQTLPGELEASRASRRRAWENLQEIRWVLKDAARLELPPPARKTIDLEGRLVKDGLKKAIRDRQLALTELVHAIKQFRKIADSKPLTLQGENYAQAVQELNKAIDRADGLLLQVSRAPSVSRHAEIAAIGRMFLERPSGWRGHLQMGLAPQGEIKAQKCQDNQRRDKDQKKDQFQSCNGISRVLQAVFASNPFLCRTVLVRRHWFYLAQS
jgi:hypothetical protein